MEPVVFWNLILTGFLSIGGWFIRSVISDLRRIEKQMYECQSGLNDKYVRRDDYQQFLTDVAEQGTGIVEGETVVEPDYIALRTGADGYASVEKQLEMQVDGTWDAHIADVKARYPKTITGGTSIADLPQWVKDIN